jgi:hypothetical protein
VPWGDGVPMGEECKACVLGTTLHTDPVGTVAPSSGRRWAGRPVVSGEQPRDHAGRVSRRTETVAATSSITTWVTPDMPNPAHCPMPCAITVRTSTTSPPPSPLPPPPLPQTHTDQPAARAQRAAWQGQAAVVQSATRPTRLQPPAWTGCGPPAQRRRAAWPPPRPRFQSDRRGGPTPDPAAPHPGRQLQRAHLPLLGECPTPAARQTSHPQS